MAKKAPNPIDKHVGSRVRMRRMMLSMSQEKLGDALNLTFQQVQKYEKGTNRIGASRLQQIANILQVPIEFFFEGAPQTGAAAASGLRDRRAADATDLVAKFFSLPHAAELAEYYVAIDGNADRHIVMNVARVIARPAIAARRAAE